MNRQFDMAYPVTHIDVLRHGECEGGHCYRGSIDVALTTRGYQQMRQSVEALSQTIGPPWQVIVSSPMQRCRQFAQDLAGQHSLPFATEPQLREMSFGDWEGQAVDKVWQEQRAQVDAWARDPVTHPPPNGEAADVFLQRVISGWQNILAQHSGQRVLCVCHGGVIRMLLAHLLAMPITSIYNIDVPFACVSRIEVTHTDAKNFYRLLAHGAN